MTKVISPPIFPAVFVNKCDMCAPIVLLDLGPVGVASQGRQRMDMIQGVVPVWTFRHGATRLIRGYQHVRRRLDLLAALGDNGGKEVTADDRGGVAGVSARIPVA
ncbi:hypothetical protein AYO44_16380 [Planctomycetaceae bacterium SCGC AG-212-F19]|nr:hypothetical protein AYO44_16380 [Planctomycetaceae bacterium SCGC AG-212-F19]